MKKSVERTLELQEASVALLSPAELVTIDGGVEGGCTPVLPDPFRPTTGPYDPTPETTFGGN